MEPYFRTVLVECFQFHFSFGPHIKSVQTKGNLNHGFYYYFKEKLRYQRVQVMMKRLAIKVCIFERHLFLCDLYVWIHLYQIDMKQDRMPMTLYKNHMPVQNREKLNVRNNYNVNHLRRSLISTFLLKGNKLYQLPCLMVINKMDISNNFI